MKKIFAVIIAVVLCAALCIAVNAEKDPNTWLCTQANGYGTGWWMTPDPGADGGYADTEKDILVTFETPNAFDGFVMACFAPGSGATVTINLYDENDDLLETTEVLVEGDHENDAHGYIPVEFSKAYAKGTYTIEFSLIAKGEGEAITEYFVLGCGAANDVEVSVSGINNVSAGAEAPAMVLYGAEITADTTAEDKPAETTAAGDETDGDAQTDAAGDQTADADTKAEDPATDAPATNAPETDAEKPAENPKTADAAIIAIASVAGIALAGVVIAKKVRK